MRQVISWRFVAAIGALQRRADAACVAGNREYNPGWHTALDLGNLLTVSEAVTRCALERRESRGGHFRDDYPDKDPAFAKFPTGATAVVDFDADEWAGVAWGTGRLADFVVPRALE